LVQALLYNVSINDPRRVSSNMAEHNTINVGAEMANNRASSEFHKALLLQQPPLVDWLEGLSHDGPFEPDQHTSFEQQTAPRLEAVPSLISLLQDSDPRIRIQVVKALEGLGERARRVLPMLRAALKEIVLKDSDGSVRSHAMHAILQVGPQPASEIAGLIDSLQDDIEVVRFHAAIALGDLGSAAQPSVPALIHTARWDENPAVRVEAALALWKIDRKGPLVIPALIEALANRNEFICWMAADSLGQIGPEAREAIPALQQALQRPFKTALIRKGVALALERIDRPAPVGSTT
jgi:HEAT repeat protein